MQTKNITLPKLNKLSPTLESTALKLMEEAGELAQAIGKLRGMSGEKPPLDQAEVMQLIAQELLDVAQTAVSMMYVLEEQYQIDVSAAYRQHLAKLQEKGYLTLANPAD